VCVCVCVCNLLTYLSQVAFAGTCFGKLKA